MKLGLGHGPRFHLNLFSPRCRWPCISQTASSIGSTSTNSSFLDNDHTSSWTYIQYLQAQSDPDPGSTLNDIELISLVNQGSLVDDTENEASGASGGEPLLLNPSDRHARRDVRTLFPENDEAGAADMGGAQAGRPSDPQYVNLSTENQYVNLSAAGQHGGHQRVEAQYVNLPLRRECVPVYTASQGSNRSSSSHGRQSLSSASFDDNEDLFPGGEHPYGIPSSLLGGVLLNLDNQFRLSANSEWENWSEFLTDSDRETTNHRNNNAGTSSSEQGHSNRTSGTSSSYGAASETIFENVGNPDTIESDQSEDANQNRVPHNTPNLIGGFALPMGHLALPAPPSSNSSTRSSRSSGGPQQQEWYFYDPRLVPESRTERVTLDTSFRGLHNRCHMSSIIQPPPYEDLMSDPPGGASAGGGVIPSALPDGYMAEVFTGDMMDNDPPPPYTDTEPPPSYDQTFGHTLAFPTFNLGLPVNPLERRLAASLCSSRPPLAANPTPDPDLLTDVNIDELLEGSPTSATDMEDGSDIEDDDDDNDFVDDIEDLEEDSDAIRPGNLADTEDERDEEDEENTDEEDLNNNFSPRRYPVGFCLGRRPPLRWSRGMSPNRWASTETWAHQ